jgi:hypothetical protein
MAYILVLGSRSLLVFIASGCSVRTVCALHVAEQARLNMDEAFCSGPGAHDDAEDREILVRLRFFPLICVDFRRAIMWIQNVTTFGDLEAASNLWRKHWLWKVTIMLEATTEFYVQMFFCRRLWVRVSRPGDFCIAHSLHRQYLGTNILSSSASFCFCSGLLPASLQYASSSFTLLVPISATQTFYLFTSILELTSLWGMS